MSNHNHMLHIRCKQSNHKQYIQSRLRYQLHFYNYSNEKCDAFELLGQSL